MEEEDPDSDRNLKNKSNLEDMVYSPVKVKKFGKLILNPKEEGYLSIRNPAAFIYNNKIGLLCTVRYKPKNSRLHLAWSKDGENFTLDKKPFIDLNNDAKKAVEDARITKINNEYFITFTAYKEVENKRNVLRIGLVKTKDFKDYYDRQIILDKRQENKNSLFFKNKVYHFIIDRPFMKEKNEKPGAQIAKVKKLNPLEIGEFQSFLLPREKTWDSARVGINTPAIKCNHKKYGKTLFMLYHGAQEKKGLFNYLGLKKRKKNIYKIGYIIVDEKNPMKILKRSEKPLIEPELDWEIGKGRYSAEVPNVVFGCGAIPINKNTIRFYYAGADKYTSFADLILNDMEILDPIFKPKTL